MLGRQATTTTPWVDFYILVILFFYLSKKNTFGIKKKSRGIGAVRTSLMRHYLWLGKA